MAALLEKDRNRIYNEFRKTLGEEATQALLSQFPARDVEEPVTKEHLDRRLAEFRLGVVDELTKRMLTIAGLGLGYLTLVLAFFG